MYMYLLVKILTNCKTVVDIAEQHAHSIIYPLSSTLTDIQNRVKHSNTANYHNVYQTTRWTYVLG